MKKIRIIIIIISLIMVQVQMKVQVKAMDIPLEIIQELKMSFSYQGKQEKNYKVLKKDKHYVYLTNSNQNEIGNNYSEETLDYSEQYNKILEYGYPNKSAEEMGVDSEAEAYIVTQEMIYYISEKREINLYQAQNEQGERIIRKIKQMIKRLEEDDITYIEKSDIWMDLKQDTTYKYKEYQIKMAKEIEEVNIKIGNLASGKIMNTEGEIINKLQNNQIFRIAVPKNVDMIFDLVAQWYCKIPNSYTMQDEHNNTYIVAKVFEFKSDRIFGFKINTKVWIDTVIYNEYETTNTPIVNNMFSILDEKHNEVNFSLTNMQGKIEVKLEPGIYYIKQIQTTQGELIKELIRIEIIGTEKIYKVNIYNKDAQKEEIIENEKEINISERNEYITENRIKDVLNIQNNYIQKDIIHQMNETNLNNVHHFTNNINRKNIFQIKKENTYQNDIEEKIVNKQNIQGQNVLLNMTREDYINYIDLIRSGNLDVPNLPIASKE